MQEPDEVRPSSQKGTIKKVLEKEEVILQHDEVAHRVADTNKEVVDSISTASHAHHATSAASSISNVASDAVSSIAIVGTALLMVASVLKLRNIVQKKAQESTTRAGKIAFASLGMGIAIASGVAIFAAPIAVAGLSLASAAVLLGQKIRSFYRAWRGKKEIINLIEQKQKKLEAAKEKGDAVREKKFKKEVEDLENYKKPEEGKKREELIKKIEEIKKKIKALESEFLKGNKTPDLKNKFIAEYDGLRKELIAKEEELNNLPGVSLVSKQQEKQKDRGRNLVMQGLTVVGLAMCVIPFPPIQIAGAALAAGVAIAGLAMTIYKHRAAILTKFDNFGVKAAKEITSGFPTVRRFFREMTNALMRSLGAKPVFEGDEKKEENPLKDANQQAEEQEPDFNLTKIEAPNEASITSSLAVADQDDAESEDDSDRRAPPPPSP